MVTRECEEYLEVHRCKTNPFLMFDASFFLVKVWGLVLEERVFRAAFKGLRKTGFYESQNDIIINNYTVSKPQHATQMSHRLGQYVAENGPS